MRELFNGEKFIFDEIKFQIFSNEFDDSLRKHSYVTLFVYLW